MLLSDSDRDLLNAQRHFAPHDVFGWHGTTIYTRQIGATEVTTLIGERRIHAVPLGDDFWAAEVGSDIVADYRLEVSWGEQTHILADPYHFLPTVGELDLHLIGEGRHERLWSVLGANIREYRTEMGTVTGTAFAVWAPNAAGVAVIGDFCGWNPKQYPMRSLGSSGVWELFIPGVGEGATYKFAITTQGGERRDKADPMAKRAEVAPATASVVTATHYHWRDNAWLRHREQSGPAGPSNEPISIYEVHVGSWRQGLGYTELATELVDYVTTHGFTHVEFLPLAEHPFGGSWGYQVTGYYAPTSRWGSPDELRALIDALHQAGIGVIVDWVPGHFPKDDWALARFDGPALYEHPDWRRGEQRDWGTYVFDWGRPQVRNFLVANALYWFEEFHIDGLRVDAVASMLYLDYSRNEGEWLPNHYGGRENLEAVQFLQEMNATVHKTFPGVLTIAEESTSWPGVTSPTYADGLGFSFKWNMGWMNDTLEYFSLDPAYRSYHHNEITFSMVYAYSERYILPFSHDEVVHGKGSLWQRMPGDTWNKAAGLRTLYGYMFSHPGKNLMFMGCELGQVTEWSEAASVAWGQRDGWEGEYHRGIERLVTELNRSYRENPALYSQDFGPEGFQWLKSDDAQGNVLSYVRWGHDGSAILVTVNLSGAPHYNYRLGSPVAGSWELIMNTDAAEFEGAGNELATIVTTTPGLHDGYEHSISLHLPAQSVQWYRLRRD